MSKASIRNSRPAIKARIKREIPERKIVVKTNIPKLLEALKSASTS